MFDMFKMMGQVKELQQKMKETQESLGTLTATGEAGAGMVKATVNGKRQLVKLDVDDDSLYNDKQMLNDLIIAATNIAMDNIDGQIKEHMKKNTEGLLPNIPGLDLNGLFNNG